jgi:hypothetical protein
MKKIGILITILILTFSLFALSGCAKAEAPTDNQPSAKIASSATDAEGVYNGQIDGGSIEIGMSPEDIVAFRTAEVQDQIATLTEGDKVRFSYAANADGQLVLSKIEKI